MANIVLLDAAKKLSKEYGYTPVQLREAIPYIRQFQGKVMVVKIGGSVLRAGTSQQTFFEDVVFMAHVGVRMILVHGGSRQLSERMREAGLEPDVRSGERYTDRPTLRLAVEVFNKLNGEIVAGIKSVGGKAIGFPASRSSIVRAERKGDDPKNFVGRVTSIDTEKLLALRDGYVPVIACLGSNGTLFNINADEVAGAIAGAMRAEKMILLTDVDGVRDESNNARSTLTLKETRILLARGVIEGGMVPKVKVCLEALQAGVHKTHIINGSRQDSLLREVLTDAGVGTEIVTRRAARDHKAA